MIADRTCGIGMIELAGVTGADVKKDPEYFKSLLRENQVLGFRKIGLSRSDFEEIFVGMGFDDSPVSKDVDHVTRFDQCVKDPELWKAKLFLTWHVEDTFKEHPAIVIAMNMHTFEVGRDKGMTGFVDMHSAYTSLPNKWREGIKDARTVEEQVAHFKSPLIHSPVKLIKEDGLTGELILHMQGYKDTIQPPYRIDIETCNGLTEDDLVEINAWTQNYLYDETNQEWWSWEQGDMVMFAGMRMAHAVTWGFELGQRVFDRGVYHGGHEEAWKVPLMDPSLIGLYG